MYRSSLIAGSRMWIEFEVERDELINVHEEKKTKLRNERVHGEGAQEGA